MRVLIFGASGFIGSSLLKFLVESGVQTGGVIRKKPIQDTEETLNCDFFVLDEKYSIHEQCSKIFEEFKPDKIVNAAAHFARNDCVTEFGKLYSANIELPYILLKNCIDYGTDFIQLSSFWQFGRKEFFESKNFYAATKNSFQLLLDYCLMNNIIKGSSVVIRDTYGPNDKRDKLLNLLIDSIIQDVEFKINNKLKFINLTHISDVVQGIYTIINLLCYEKYYELSYPYEIKTRELEINIKKLYKDNKYLLKNKNIKFNFKNKNNSKSMAPSPPGWKVSISLENGILDLCKYKLEELNK